MNFLPAALKYISLNISVIPTDEVKRSIIPWKPYQERLMNEEELKETFSNPKVKGIAAICGQISLNMECVDVDVKYDVTGTLYADYIALIKQHNAELFDKLVIIQTKSGGYHFYYRCEVIEGNQKLAMRPCTDEEKKDNPNVKMQVLIETRGEAGYVIASPTPGYKKIAGDKIPILSIDERELLLDLARTFNQVIAEPQRISSQSIDQKQYGLSPFEDYNQRGDVEGLLVKHGWTFDYERGGKNFYIRPGKKEGVGGSYWPEKKWFGVFTTSSEFQTNKAYSPAGVFALLEAGNDFSKAAKMLLDMGYGEKRVSFGKLEGDVLKKKRDGKDREEIKSYIVKNYTEVKTDSDAEKVLDKIEKQFGNDLCTFWDVSYDDEGSVNKVTINRYKLERFLSEVGGFHLYFYDKNSNIFKVIQERNGLITEASTEQIKKFVKDYVLNLPEWFDGISKENLLEVIYKGSETYFSKSFFEFIERKDIDFLKDTATEAFFPFKNGVVVVTATTITLKSYGELKKAIWASQVIDFNIDILQELETGDAEICDLIKKICNDDEDRTARAFTLIGYILHKFKDPAKPYAVIFCEETEDESKGGGTGKGLLVKALTKILNTVTVDGKTYKNDKGFLWQRVNLDTELLFIDDAKKNFDFESLYSVITEGITVEKKNKDEVHISFEDSPKVIVTTNYTISKKGNHAKRRQQDLEFSSFFNPQYTPLDHFKHRLYDDWDKDEWNRFYNLMFWCVKLYLNTGVIEAKNSMTAKRKHIKLTYTEEFLEWFDEYSGNGCETWKSYKDLYEGFLMEADLDKKVFISKKFKKAMEESSDSFGFICENRRNRQANNVREIRIVKSN